jgi:hypothetical protein
MYCHLRHQYRNDYLASSTAANTIPIHEAALQDTELLRIIISGIEFPLRLKSSCIKNRGGRRRFFCARKREAKKEKKSGKARRKKARKKAKALSAKEKKREFVLFPLPTIEIRFQSPKPLGRGKTRILNKTGRRGQAKWDRQNRIRRTGQAEQDWKNRTGSKGQAG